MNLKDQLVKLLQMKTSGWRGTYEDTGMTIEETAEVIAKALTKPKTQKTEG
jgi:hypothetical protein